MTRPILQHLILAAAFFAKASLGTAAPPFGDTTSAGPTFVDPTAVVTNGQNVRAGGLVYVGPFAKLKAGATLKQAIRIGDESNVQDNVTVDATAGEVVIGDRVILAHGCTVKAVPSKGNVTQPTRLGVTLGSTAGVDPALVSKLANYGNPSFVSFNAEVGGAIIEKNAMVGALCKVGAGVTIPSFRKVLPGKFVKTQAEVATKCVPVTDADAEFMRGVIEVNTSFAQNYTDMEAAGDANGANYVTGVNYDPGASTFNPNADLPTLAGVPTSAPEFRNRIIGDVRLSDSLPTLNKVMAKSISLRADEGEPFTVGTIRRMKDRVTFHALEGSSITIGNQGLYGVGSIVHGGANAAIASGPAKTLTLVGDNFNLGGGALFFRSRAGKNVTLGARSIVQDSDVPDNFVVLPKHIVVGGVDQIANGLTVEW